MGSFDIFRKEQVELTESQLKWNKMWELWAEGKAASPYAELMTYQGEVNNGGHDQYFTNVESAGDLSSEMSALEQILPAELKSNLKKAYQAYSVLEENEYDEEAEEALERCDSVFYENEEKITHALEEYAAAIKL